jgi:beta-glucanase (GH16 family)
MFLRLVIFSICLVGIQIAWSQVYPTGNMTLIWHDEFDRMSVPDTSCWGYEYGLVRNNELQWYQPQNARCVNGSLVIEGKQEVVTNSDYQPESSDWRKKRQVAQYTSSSLITKGKAEFHQPCYIEVRARIDTSHGAWPAIWLLGNKGHWPFCGEIDMMEFYRINHRPTILANVAWGSETESRGEWSTTKLPLSVFTTTDKNWCSKFHTWAMLWNNETIQVFIDGQPVHTTLLKNTINPDETNPFQDQSFYLILNLALGANGGEPVCTPILFEVDYVRVYKYINQ